MLLSNVLKMLSLSSAVTGIVATSENELFFGGKPLREVLVWLNACKYNTNNGWEGCLLVLNKAVL